jgi:tRNA pseudouridine13 synthase
MSADGGAQLRLRQGADAFQVHEEEAYAASGSGEHVYLEIEKEGLTTDAVVEVLAKHFAVRRMDVGYAGRKDRHAITRQWFSVHSPRQERAEDVPTGLGKGRITVLQRTRHGNKLRLGHLAGNRFRLGLELTTDPAAVPTRPAAEGAAAAIQALRRGVERVNREGLINRFGEQRFGLHGASLHIARAWGAGQTEAAVERIVDPSGAWRWGDPVPDGYRAGLEGQAIAALRRRGGDAGAVLRASGDGLRHLIASAAQSAIFNAVLEQRQALGILHTLRPGDLGHTQRGAPFLVTDQDHAASTARAAPGVLDAFTTGPLPGSARLRPAPAVLAEERAWSAATGLDWAWLERGGALESPGERRSCIVPLRAPATLVDDGPGRWWLNVALPAGSYATALLAELGVAVPEDRAGRGAVRLPG